MLQVIEQLDTKFLGTAGGYDIYAHVGANSGELYGLFTRSVNEASCVRLISFSDLDRINGLIQLMVPSAKIN